MSELLDSSSHVGVQHFLHKLKGSELDRPGTKGLVVGFGEGHEADHLQRHSDSTIVGIDINSRIPEGVTAEFLPILASAMTLPFKPESRPSIRWSGLNWWWMRK